MSEKSKNYLSLFFTGIVQVALVSVNVYQIAHEKYIGVFLVGFVISLVWSFNVKKIALGGWADRLVYASGAALGSLLGLVFAKVLYLL